jgi:hypothetical protein
MWRIEDTLTVRIELVDGVIPKGISGIPINFRFPNGKSWTPYVYKEDNYVIEFVEGCGFYTYRGKPKWIHYNYKSL